MSEFKKDQIVRCWPGATTGRSYIAVIISEGVVEFGSTDCVRTRRADGGTDYLAVTHVSVIGRVEGDTGYVQTVADAFAVSDIPLDSIVIEDRAESLKAKKLIKGFRSVKL